MQFGIQHGMGDPHWKPGILEPQTVAQFAKKIEEAGYAYLGFTDHPAPSGRWVDHGGEGVVDLFSALSFCAAVTTKIRLLTWILVLPYHNPLAAAHRIASLDVLSGGRLTVGLGTGYLKSEFYALGVDFEKRRELFDSHLQVMLKALAGEDVDAEGKGYCARGTRILPPALQKPHPPLWIHGNSPFGAKRAASHAQGWAGIFTEEPMASTIRTTPINTTEDYSQRLDFLRDQLQLQGKTLADMEIVASAVVPMLDIRTGWNRQEYQDRFALMESLGVDTIMVNAIGDDPVASEESAMKFAEDFIL